MKFPFKMSQNRVHMILIIFYLFLKLFIKYKIVHIYSYIHNINHFEFLHLFFSLLKKCTNESQ